MDTPNVYKILAFHSPMGSQLCNYMDKAVGNKDLDTWDYKELLQWHYVIRQQYLFPELRQRRPLALDRTADGGIGGDEDDDDEGWTDTAIVCIAGATCTTRSSFC
jgi:hypothetical protein